MRILFLVIALHLAGIDFIRDMFRPRKRRQFFEYCFQTRHPLVDAAWKRVVKNPGSLFHEWTNLAVSWFEPGQEIPAKVIGFFLLVSDSWMLIKLLIWGLG